MPLATATRSSAWSAMVTLYNAVLRVLFTSSAVAVRVVPSCVAFKNDRFRLRPVDICPGELLAAPHVVSARALIAPPWVLPWKFTNSLLISKDALA